MKKSNDEARIAMLEANCASRGGQLVSLEKLNGDLLERIAVRDREIGDLKAKLAAAERNAEKARESVTALKGELFRTSQELARAEGRLAHMKENEIIRELGPAVEQPSRSRRDPGARIVSDIESYSLNPNGYLQNRQETNWWDR